MGAEPALKKGGGLNWIVLLHASPLWGSFIPHLKIALWPLMGRHTPLTARPRICGPEGRATGLALYLRLLLGALLPADPNKKP